MNKRQKKKKERKKYDRFGFAIKILNIMNLDLGSCLDNTTQNNKEEK